MSLTSPQLLWIVAALAVILPVLMIILWGLGPRGISGRLIRLAGIVLCQLLAVGAIGLYANNQYGFYNNWGELAGESDASAGAVDLTGLVPADGSQGRVMTFSVKVPGAKGIGAARLPVLVWLPKGYDQLTNRLHRYPTVMVLPGQPSTPEAMFNGFSFGQQATQAIDSGKVQAVHRRVPAVDDRPAARHRVHRRARWPAGRDLAVERACGTQVSRKVRSDPSGSKWSAMGFSTGGFCSAKLLSAPPPHDFSAAVSFGGYYDAETDPATGDLFKGNRRLRNENSPIWLIKQPPQQQSDLLIVASKQDTDSWAPGAKYADTSKMVTQSTGIPGVATLLLNGGGHNYTTYGPTLPQSLTWLEQVGAL